VPSAAKIIPILTQNSANEVDLTPISLRSIGKLGRYLVVNFGSCT